MDNTDMQGSHDVQVGQKKNVKCFNCGGPYYRSACPLLSSNTREKMRQKPRRRSYHCKRGQGKKIVTFAADNAQNYLDVNIKGRSLRFQLDQAQMSRWYHVESGRSSDLHSWNLVSCQSR
ncbi:hypothetical protein RB195_023066 [Necator americanus]|uniref:Eukaryotic translation initiation factor 3 subunit G N-terminal domain-containing protein n=1 Tax=Necator americanus TaxID=51031 RepID=A0ABR1EJZ4_NECAM